MNTQVLCWKDICVDSLFFLFPGSSWGLIYTFGNAHLHLSYSPLVCSPRLHLNLLYSVCYASYYFFLFALKPVLSSLRSVFFFNCPLLTCLQLRGLWCQAHAPSLIIPCLCSFTSSCVSTSQGLCYRARPGFIHTKS